MDLFYVNSQTLRDSWHVIRMAVCWTFQMISAQPSQTASRKLRICELTVVRGPLHDIPVSVLCYCWFCATRPSLTWVLWNVKVSTELLPSQRERIALGRQPEANENVFSTHGPTTPSPTAVSSLKMRDCPPTFLFGFSKGGVVLNQVLAEMTHLEDLVSRKKKQQRQIRRRVASEESAKFGVSLLNQ